VKANNGAEKVEKSHDARKGKKGRAELNIKKATQRSDVREIRIPKTKLYRFQ